VLRRFVALSFLACALAPSGDARAFGDDDKLTFAQVVHGGHWNTRPTAPRRLAWEIEKRTSILTVAEPVSVRLTDEAALRRYPLLVLSGDGAFPLPSDDEIARLRRHLQEGGLLVVDNAEGRPGGAFDESARALIARLFPRQTLDKISPDHVLYKTFYLLRTPVGRLVAAPYLEGISYDGRLVVVYSQNDLQGAWARDGMGRWEHPVYPGGEAQREMAIRLGVNIAMYALCLDYKSDQVHVPFILRRRQWQSR
jgi:hypothetical protein